MTSPRDATAATRTDHADIMTTRHAERSRDGADPDVVPLTVATAWRRLQHSVRWPAWAVEDEHDGPNRAGVGLVLMCLGAFLVSCSFWAGRGGHPLADACYWTGQALLIVPVTIRVLAPRVRLGERAALLTGQAALQSFSAWAYSPDRFRYPDELQHLRTVEDVLRTGHLFTPNSYLSVSPGFPGMEIATSAVRNVTGLSTFAAGVLVVSACHTVVPVLVLALAREVTGSAHTGAIAALVYGTAPHHGYYNTLFVYGAVALPFVVACMWAAVRSRRAGTRALAVLPPFVVVLLTHHLSVAFTIAGLVACVLVQLVGGVGRDRVRRLAGVTAVAVLLATAWTSTVAADSVAYLAVPFRTLVGTLLGASGSGPGDNPVIRNAFSPPRWESLTSMGAAGLTLMVVAVGVVVLWRSDAPRVLQLFSLLAVGYPVTLAVRVAAAGGAELASRGLTYVMLFAAVPAAVTMRWLWQTRQARVGRVVAGAVAVTMLLGAVTAGLPPWYARIPRGFIMVGAESGIDRSVVSVGEWAAAVLPQDSRVVCDLSVCSVVASYARATPTTTGSDLYYGPAGNLSRRLGEESLDYLFIDRRMTQQLPATGSYFAGDVKAGEHTSPLDPKLLAKFEVGAGIDRVYDNGFIQAYSTRRAWS